MVWQFSGQGNLQIGIARDMYETEAAFREAMTYCDELTKAHCGIAPSELLYPDLTNRFDASKAHSLLSDTRYGQPVLVAVEYAMAQVWIGRGLFPSTVLGHSLGEYAAAVIAGVMSIEDCMYIVCKRGQLMAQCTEAKGSMVAVRASSHAVEKVISELGLSKEVSLGSINSDRSVVISGSSGAVEACIAAMNGVSNRKLNVEHGFHSPIMAPMVEPFRNEMSSIRLSPPNLRFVSTVFGKEVKHEMAAADYWVDHILNTVRYQDAMMLAHKERPQLIVEIGPNTILTNLSRSLLSHDKDIVLLSSI
jgi:acyl transferase domain-containing protein